MLLGGLLRDEQGKQQVDRLVVHGIEIHAVIELHESADRGLGPSHATMRQGDTMAEASATQFLSSDQAVEHFFLRELWQTVCNHRAQLLEGPFLAARLYVACHPIGLNQLFDLHDVFFQLPHFEQVNILAAVSGPVFARGQFRGTFPPIETVPSGGDDL